jgi:hypothetical protein
VGWRDRADLLNQLSPPALSSLQDLRLVDAGASSSVLQIDEPESGVI